jgi:hypothetical protein
VTLPDLLPSGSAEQRPAPTFPVASRSGQLSAAASRTGECVTGVNPFVAEGIEEKDSDMTTVETARVRISLAVILMIVIAYAAGRVHQWCRRTMERDTAHREGYAQASRTLFPLAVRKERHR